MVHAVPKGVQLPSRHLYLLERLEDKVAAINSRIAAWQNWLAAALTPAAVGAAGAADGSSADSSIEWSPVGACVQVGWDMLLFADDLSSWLQPCCCHDTLSAGVAQAQRRKEGPRFKELV